MSKSAERSEPKSVTIVPAGYEAKFVGDRLVAINPHLPPITYDPVFSLWHTVVLGLEPLSDKLERASAAVRSKRP